MALNELTKEIHDNAVSHGWWDEPRNLLEIAALCRRKQAEIEGRGGIKKLNQPSMVPGRPIGRKIFRFLRSFENERQWGAQKQQNYK